MDDAKKNIYIFFTLVLNMYPLILLESGVIRIHSGVTIEFPP